MSHRLILMAILGRGEMCVSGLSDCEDVKSSLACFKALGGQAQVKFDGLCLTGLEGRPPVEAREIDFDCGNSGTTMRLLSGVLAGLPGRFVLDGDWQLRRRPMERVAEPLRHMGAKIATSGGRPPVAIEGGRLHGIEYRFSDASAQLKGAAILAALQAEGPSRITEIAPTRDHTERLVTAFGGRIVKSGLVLEVHPGPLALPAAFQTPADPSAAAFFLCGAAFMPGSRVTARNILLSPGRIGFLRVLDRLGAQVAITLGQEKPEPTGDVTVEYAGKLTATEIPAEEVPAMIDEIPILALTAAFAKGRTIFRQVGELRVKETDRLTAIKHQLGALGVRVMVDGDDLHVEGPTSLILPESLDSGHDHRLAMTLHVALAAAGAGRPILGAESMAVSYPDFVRDLTTLSQA